MNCSRSTTFVKARVRRGFTLVEVLAALLFMGIVIPVAMRALQIAALAGEVGQRKAVAVRMAERVINDLIITGQYRSGTQRGVMQEGKYQYEWNLRSQSWSQDLMQEVSVQVVFQAQGKDYDVVLTTLVDNSI